MPTPHEENRWKKGFSLTEGTCVYCGIQLHASLDIYHSSSEDHLIPAHHHGGTCMENLRPACGMCNGLKDNSIPPGVKSKNSPYPLKEADLGAPPKPSHGQMPDGDLDTFFQAVREHLADKYADRVIYLENQLKNMGVNRQFHLDDRPRLKDLFERKLKERREAPPRLDSHSAHSRR